MSDIIIIIIIIIMQALEGTSRSDARCVHRIFCAPLFENPGSAPVGLSPK